MYDLHAHILPGVDDGAKTSDDTLEMLRVAAEDGTKVMLATPHRKDITERSSVARVHELVVETNQRIQEAGLDITLAAGMENHLDLDLPEEVKGGRALVINGSRYILVELPFFGRPNYAEEVLSELQAEGLVPVLAHPERLEVFITEPDLLDRLVSRGMLTQVTAGSILGYFGRDVRKFTRRLLRRGMVHILASDTHFPGGHRSPRLVPGVKGVSKIVGEQRALAMVVDVPRAVLEDREVDLPSSSHPTKARRWWRFWDKY